MDEHDELKKMVEDTGLKIGMNSDDCVLYKTTHKNCNGCEYELGCGKIAALKVTQLSGLLYKPKDFDDFRASSKRVGEIMNEILEAQTVDEVKKLI